MDNVKEIFVSIMLNKITHKVGKLWFHNRKGRTAVSFEYSREWLGNPHKFALEPALTLSEAAFHTGERGSMFGAMGDSAPDRWGRILMQRANDTGRTLTEADYLLGVCDETRQGALRFSVKEGEYLASGGNNVIPPFITLPNLLSASGKILDNTENAKDLQLLLAPGSSLGGARPKASVLDKDGSLAIAKFPMKDDDTDIVRWEATALTLAKAAGITVSEFRLEIISGKPVLIIKRFDRIGDIRIPFISAMSMIGASYGDDQNYSYIDIANSLQQYGARPKIDMEELWRRIVFSIMISNTDDHLRNHGFLYSMGQGWILSPAYDLNPNITRDSFATAIDQTSSHNTIERALCNISAFNLTEPQAKKIISEVKKAVSMWRTTAQSLGITGKNIDKMKLAFLD